MDEGFRIELVAGSVAAPVRWRLVEPDGTEIGRGATGYPDAALCHGVLHTLQRDALVLDRRPRELEPGRWQWELRRSGSAIACGSRVFAARGRCELAMLTFVLAFADAPVVPGLTVLGSGCTSQHRATALAEAVRSRS